MLERFFELEEAISLEPYYADLIDPCYTGVAASLEPEDVRLLLDQDGELLAAAMKLPQAWVVANFTHRPCIREIIEMAEALEGDLYQDDREEYLDAQRAYYSQMLMEEISPGIEDIRPDRVASVQELFCDIWGGSFPAECIDCCCGSGIGARVLREMGCRVLAYDNDPRLLALGLASGRLAPAGTMLIDATMASQYLGPVEAGFALMLGDIASFNADMWEAVVDELLQLSAMTVITVATGEECDRVAGWCGERGRSVEVFEQDRDPIYDRWVCIAKAI
ncbi:MAG: hypothetical protein RQ758_06880 [Methanomicrobiaceae archaeon]|nr:hypothetical protein [Methanomicrobiaceae archaeon]